jgi:hypothetical protein
MHVVHGGLSAPSKCVLTPPQKGRCTQGNFWRKVRGKVRHGPSSEGPMHAKPLLRLRLERVQFVLEVLDPLPDRLPLLATED